jgi:hypothetical protein
MVKSVGRKVSGMGGRKGSAAVAGGGGKPLTGKMTDKKVKQLKNADDYNSRPIWAKDITEKEYKQIIGAPTRDAEGVLRQQKRGGKVMYREEGGPLKGDQKKLDTNNDGKITNKDLKTLRAKPKSKPPVTNSTNPKTGATRGSGAPMVPVKKMGGGKVMKYKKGGMVYMKNGGVVKASKDGDDLVSSCYD